MPSTQKLPSGSWRCRIHTGEGKYKSFTASTKREAEAKAYAYLEDHPTDLSDGVTLRQAMFSYINSKSAILSPATLVGYKNIVKNHLPALMEKQIESISMQEYQSAVNEEAKQYSPKTVRNIVGLLVPAVEMFGVRAPSLSVPQKEKQEVVIPTDEEVALLLCNADRYKVKIPICLAAYMGMRRSEISAFMLDRDLDLDKHTITVREAVVIGEGNELKRKLPKSLNSKRILPIPDFLLPLLKKAKENGEEMPSPGIIENRFIDLRDALGLKHIRFHSLRHYYASALVMLGVPDFYAVKLMGHGSDSMLKTVYQHLRKDYLADVSNRIEDFFSKKYDTNMTRNS